MRRLPGPAVWRLSEGDQTPEALYELARKLVAYLLAVDRRKQNFVSAEEFRATPAA